MYFYSFIHLPTDFYVSMVCFDYLLDLDFISFECFPNKECFQILIESLILPNFFSSFACFECYNKVPGLLETTEKTRFTLKACYRK